MIDKKQTEPSQEVAQDPPGTVLGQLFTVSERVAIDDTHELVFAPTRRGMSVGLVQPSLLREALRTAEARSEQHAAATATARVHRKLNSGTAPVKLAAEPWYRRFTKR